MQEGGGLWMLAKSLGEHSILRLATTGGRIGLTANRAAWDRTAAKIEGSNHPPASAMT